MQTRRLLRATILQINASDSASGQSLTYAATGLPAGLTINTATALISGTPTTAGASTVTVTATDRTGANGSATFPWTINPASGGCTNGGQLLGNPGFETGAAAPWTTSSGVINTSGTEPAHSGSWDAWMDGYGTTHTDTLTQSVALPTGCTTAKLSFWLHIDTAETSTTAYDTITVQILDPAEILLATPATYSNLDHTTGYIAHTVNLAPYAGQTVTVRFTGTEDKTQKTSFVLDDTAVTVS